MPRNSSGTYSLPEAAFVPSTPISSTAVNSDFDDIADALTDSLSRTGDGGMQAILPLSSSGFNYQGDSNTGMRRSAADAQAIYCGGVDVVTITAAGIDVTGLTIAGESLLPVGMVSMWSGSTAPTGWLFPGTYNRADHPALWTFANTEIGLGNTLYGVGNGTTTFTIATMDGYVPAGVDAASARIASFTHVGDTAGAASVTLAANQIPTITSVNASQSITVNYGGNILRESTAALNDFGNPGGSGLRAGDNTSSLVSASSPTNNSISVTYTNASPTVTPIVQPSRAFKFIVYAGAN